MSRRHESAVGGAAGDRWRFRIRLCQRLDIWVLASVGTQVPSLPS